MAAPRKPYLSLRRQERAAETRRRLAQSARRMFRGHGYAGTTIADIAADAGLAVQTFYAVYGSKRAVLSALIDSMEEAADLSGLRRELAQTDDVRRQLALLVAFNLRLFEQGADVLDTLRSAGFVEPDLATAYADGESRRRRDQSRLVDRWSAERALRRGLGKKDAADILWGLTSPEVYRLFVNNSGWPAQRFGVWLRDLLDKQLFD